MSRYLEGRFYQNQLVGEDLDLNQNVIAIDNTSWKRPRKLSLEKLGDILKIKVNDSAFPDKNITSIKISDQEDNPKLPPNILSIVKKSYIAIDNNYLYVWIETQKKWKRIPLSEW